MEKLAALLGGYVYKHSPSAAFSYEMYKYSFEIILETAAGIIASIFIAVWLNMKLEGCIFFLEFFLLRSYAGGLHFKKFWLCFSCSALFMLGILMTVKYFTVPIAASAVLLFFSASMFLLTQQVDDKNRKVEADEAVYFRKKLIQVLMAIVIVYIFFVAAKQAKYAFLVALTAAMVYVLMLIGKWKNRVGNAL